MDKKEQLILLLAELGAFFSKCDADYDIREKDFVSRYLKVLQENNAVTEAMCQSLHAIGESEFSIEQILSDTKSFMNLLDKEEVDDCMSAVDDFIVKLIHADGVVHEQEDLYLKQWREIVRLDLKSMK